MVASFGPRYSEVATLVDLQFKSQALLDILPASYGSFWLRLPPDHQPNLEVFLVCLTEVSIANEG